MPECIIKTENLSKKYKHYYALQDASVTIEKGNIYGLVGENGAGKTTFIKMLAGLIRPTSGKIFFRNDCSERGLLSYRKRMGFIVENPYLNPDMTAYENLNLQRIQRGISDKEKIEEVLSIVDLENTPKKVKEYSLGMKQRLGIAMALLNEIEVLVLDEPTNGLDPVGISEFRKMIVNLNKKYEITIIISSHILSELEQIITDVIFISKSKVLRCLSMGDVLEDCKKKMVLKVSDTQKIKESLNEHGIGYDVTEEEQLIIYGDYDVRTIAQYIFDKGCQTFELREEKQTLEQYYMSLIGGNREEYL
jgi:ABC-2 type transport system ATP-binding protein